MRKETYEGEREIVEESPFPMMVDPGFYRETEELWVYRHDGGIWVGFLPLESAAVQLKLGVQALFLNGDRVDSSHFIDTMRRFEPDADELDGYVEMQDPAEVAEIDIPFETWVAFPRVTIEKLVIDYSYSITIEELHLEHYSEPDEPWYEPGVNPFA